MKVNHVKRIGIQIVSCAALFAVAVSGVSLAVSADDAYSEYISLPPVQLDLQMSYSSYMQQHRDKNFAESTVSVNLYATSDSEGPVERTENGLKTPEEGFVEWKVHVPEAGLYSMEVEYYPTSGKSSSIMRSVYLDGTLPFEEARSIVFNRVWVDKKDEFGHTIKDAPNGSQIRPEQIEQPDWQTVFIRDSVGYYPDPLHFYLSEGEHTLRFVSVREPMEIRKITLKNPKQPRPYGEVKSQILNTENHAADAPIVKLQGEYANYKSDPMLVPGYDRSTSAMEPSDPVELKLNCIGGTQWQLNGQTLTWVFQVPEDGLYHISFRGIQNIKNGSLSSRRIYINGRVPYEELEAYSIPYSTQWQMYTLGTEDEHFAFPFKKGEEYRITFEVTMGEMSQVIRRVNEIVNELNSIYRDILVITGPTPDTYRDYQFKDVLPETMANLKVQAQNLREVLDQLVAYSGMQGESVQIIKRLITQTEEMYEKPHNIAKRFTAFQQNISSLGTWVSSESMQPLSIDYLAVIPVGQEIPKASAGFWADLVYHLRSFISSFTHDYNNLDYGSGECKQTVTVWIGNGVTGGRDQAQVLKNMADNYFTSETGINANIQLISMGALLPATLAGKGPDVALSLAAGEVCNYAFRTAAIDLAQFPDYGEVSTRFNGSALVPLSFEKGVYGLPETQTFPMLFYRKDILSKLNLAIPQTWDDVLVMLPMLQKNKMNFGLPTAISSPMGMNYKNFLLFLFQAGGNIYSEGGKKALLDNDLSVDKFSFMTSLYTDYGLPKEYNFLNQFRSGSVPIGVSDYSLFNQLSVFAPELNGLWGFTSVPGTKDENGKIDRSVPGEVNACMILSKSQHQQEAWEFIKWWTDAPTQSRFGRELESIMGTAARYPTANKEALYSIPWSKNDFECIADQMNWVRGVEEVPGGYYTQRYMDFAFKDVVNSKEKPAKMLTEAVRNINNEIVMKRREFGLKD